MRRSSTITLTVLAGLMLTCCLTTPRWRHREPDYTWYDANGNRIAEQWKTDASGHKVPYPHVPYDRYHRPWVYSNGTWHPLPPPNDSSSSSSTSHSYYPRPWFFWGGSGYRSFGSGSSRSRTSPSSISRGGFGSTGFGGG